MKYFLVTAKCGHVGKGKYIEVDFPICAESMHDAAQRCLQRPKVKRHLKNAISSVSEVSFEEYRAKKLIFAENTFIKAHTKKETREWLDEVQALEFRSKRKRSFSDRNERINFLLKKNKLKEDYHYA